MKQPQIEPHSTKLYHHGINGQRWGRRRWQNEDGTLTPEGRRRYGLVGKDANIKSKDIRREYKEAQKNVTSKAYAKAIDEKFINKYGTKRVNTLKTPDVGKVATIGTLGALGAMTVTAAGTIILSKKIASKLFSGSESSKSTSNLDLSKKVTSDILNTMKTQKLAPLLDSPRLELPLLELPMKSLPK